MRIPKDPHRHERTYTADATKGHDPIRIERLSASAVAGLELLEEVIALVVHEDEGREVLNSDLPDGLHTQLGICHALNRGDALLRENGCDTADGTEIEATVLLAGVGNDLCTVTLGDHHQ